MASSRAHSQPAGVSMNHAIAGYVDVLAGQNLGGFDESRPKSIDVCPIAAKRMAGCGRIWGKFGRRWPRALRSRRPFCGDCWTGCDRLLAGFGQTCPMLLRFVCHGRDRILRDFGRTRPRFARTPPNSTEIAQTPVVSGPTLAERRTKLAALRQLRPNLHPIDSGQISAEVSPCSPSSSQFRPVSADVDRHRVNFGRAWPQIGRLRPEFVDRIGDGGQSCGTL